MQESCRGGSPLLQPLTKTFMGIFVSPSDISALMYVQQKTTKRTIATWLLETDSESEGINADHDWRVENPGKMVLIKLEKFYYPCRLINHTLQKKEWTVKYWRGDMPSPVSSHTQGGYSQVPESHLIDALWHNRSERRQTHVSIHTRSCKHWGLYYCA